MIGFLLAAIAPEPAPLFISLGSACEVVANIENHGLRHASFPFDWLLSVGPQAITQVLKDDFQFFLDEDYFDPHPYHRDVIVNRRYRIELRHDWLGTNLWDHFYQYRETLPEIREKYQRRIARFKSLGEYPGKVFSFAQRLISILSPASLLGPPGTCA